MSNPSTPDLGNVVTSPTARRVIYSVYTIAVLVIGAIQIAFAAVGQGQPNWLIATLAIVGYLGVPVGGLALVNTAKPKDDYPTT